MSGAPAWDEDNPTQERRHLPAVAPAAGPVPATTTLDLAPQAWTLAHRIANTDFVPRAMRGKPEAVLAAMLTGNELGLPLMTSLSKIHVVDGRPGLASETMRSLVLAAGHELWIESKSNTAVTVGGKRAGSSREQRVTWTIDDARAANLAGKDNWKKYPRAMLTARAMAELCRDLFPDVIGGLYAVEELQDGFEFDQLPVEGEPVDEPAPARKVSSPAAKKRAASRARKAAGEGPEPEPPALPDDDIEDAVIVEPVAEEEPPPLPDDEAPTEDGTSAVVRNLQEKGDRVARAQQIAIRARELGVDRADVIVAVTAGAKSSGKDLDEAEGDQVLEALRRLKVGEIRLVHVDGVPTLVDAPEVPNEADDEVVQGELIEDDEEPAAPVGLFPADGDGWRQLIRSKGRSIADAVRFATRRAHELEVAAPTSVSEIAEADPQVRAELMAWLGSEDGGEG